MKIFITGGLGFVGRSISKSLLEGGHRVTAVGRSKHPRVIDHPDFDYISADTTQPGEWQKIAGDHQVMVNLAGRSIFTIWTERAKREMVDSRILTTRHLVDAIPPDGRTVLCSTSAVGYYGDRHEALLTEQSPPGDDFLADLSRQWEAEALKAEAKGARVVLMRFGIVLDRHGGAMAMMIPAFRLYLGGRLGNGRQWFPWIHRQDLAAACRFVVE
ncbi:MAG: NAD-dependent epimerase/dehydratase family protein, partial [Desulfosarcina sp.]